MVAIENKPVFLLVDLYSILADIIKLQVSALPLHFLVCHLREWENLKQHHVIDFYLLGKVSSSPAFLTD